jgi:hypothetical protein
MEFPTITGFRREGFLLAYINKIFRAGLTSGMAGSRDSNAVTKTEFFS